MKKSTFWFGLFWLILGATSLHGQASLNIQGIIRKATGTILDDGTYSMTFRIYTVSSGGSPLWSETQNNVDVASGVYGTLLGTVTPLEIPFDRPYFLGVSVDGGAEISPRIRLTAAPYSLAHLGHNNVFPSMGAVGIGTTEPDTSARMHVKNPAGTGRILIEGLDSASVVLKTLTNSSSITYDGNKIYIPDLSLDLSKGVNLPAGQSVKYNNLPTWRLVEVDDFSASEEGWSCTDGWASSTPANFERFRPETPFNHYILRPTDQGDDAMVKQFDLTGIPHTMIKVVFTYHFFDSWDAPNEFGYAGFGTKKAPSDGANQTTGIWQIGWRYFEHWPNGLAAYDSFTRGAGYANFNSGKSDYSLQGEMVAQTSDDKFWVIFGSNLNEATNNESYGISNVQIWVR